MLDPWQDEVLRAAMGERADGRWLSPRVGLSAPRQNGKSQLIVSRALAGALLFGERKIVISAHQADTARETFSRFLELIEDSPALASRIVGNGVPGKGGVMNALNREYIKFTNGAKIQFKARTLAGTRGYSCDCLFLDEAQRLSRAAWVSINSTMSARRNPQAWLMGTPPTPVDDGAVFAAFRKAAMDSPSPTATYLEWSAEPGDDPASEETRAKANPAWYTRINHDVVQGEFETYTPQEFAWDRLGIWSGAAGLSIFPGWAGLLEPGSIDGRVGVTLALDLDPASMTVAAAARRPSGDLVDVRIEHHKGDPVEAVARLRDRFGVVAPVVLVGRNAAALKPSLEAAGVDCEALTALERIAACQDLAVAVEGSPAQVVDGVDVPARAPVLRHAGQEPLDRAVESARWSTSPDGRVIDRKTSASDVSPLYAVAGALWALSSSDDADYDLRASYL